MAKGLLVFNCVDFITPAVLLMIWIKVTLVCTVLEGRDLDTVMLWQVCFQILKKLQNFWRAEVFSWSNYTARADERNLLSRNNS